MNTIHRLTSEGKSPYEVGNLVGISTAEALEAMKQAADETIAEAEMAGWDEVERMPEDDDHAHCAKEFREGR